MEERLFNFDITDKSDKFYHITIENKKLQNINNIQG